MKANWPLTLVFSLQLDRIKHELLHLRGGASVPVKRPQRVRRYVSGTQWMQQQRRTQSKVWD